MAVGACETSAEAIDVQEAFGFVGRRACTRDPDNQARFNRHVLQ